jgi:DNA-binding LacI/PurR family transcriptional regulator
MGATGAKRLISRIEGEKEPAMEIMIGATLIKRESTAALKS